MKTLYTDRLILRSWNECDVDDLFEYAKNPNVGPNAGWKPHESKEESLKILRSFIEKDEVWAIVYKENNKVIGSFGLHTDGKRDNDKSKMIGYVLSEDYWGKELMPEAVKRVLEFVFEELHLNVVSVFHYPHNMRSKSVIIKSDFKFEGILRNAAEIYNGKIYDDVCYSITKDEFMQLHS